MDYSFLDRANDFYQAATELEEHIEQRADDVSRYLNNQTLP
jgi:hypothetical protein